MPMARRCVRVPTLVLTANPDHSVAARAMDAGVQGALSKVLSMPETVGAIKGLPTPILRASNRGRLR
jgi:DNA-binding NarL/FixJ family response regulator